MIEQERNKVLVATVMWKRHDLFRKFVHHYQNLGFDVLAVGSEGSTSEELCERLGCAYIECPNDPFMVKLNRRVDYFLEHPEYTHILFVGSDNFLDVNALNHLMRHINKYDIVSWSDMYVFCADTHQILYASGYTKNRRGEPYAPGRCMSRKVIEEMNGMLWISKHNKTAKWPDAYLWSKLKQYDSKIDLKAASVDGFLVDIKTKTNINSFKKVYRAATRNGSQSIKNNPELVQRFLNLLEDYE
jgi:hypothetical protein